MDTIVLDDIIDNQGDVAIVSFAKPRPNYKISPKGLTEVRCFIGWGSGALNLDGYVTWVPVYTEWWT